MELISVVMITYNHEQYIKESIQSVLEQTYKNIELVIVNDGSTDNTESIIRLYSDSRIKYIYQKNQGPSIATNNGIKRARGKYIALMSGDDVCQPRRLEAQIKVALGSKKKVIFSLPEYINSKGNSPKKKHFATDSFFYLKATRCEVLNYFFNKGNFLCAPSAFFEKKLFEDIGGFNPALLQLQDWDYWVRAMIYGYEIEIINEKLVKYRVRDDHLNLSTPYNIETSIRSAFEKKHVLENFLSINSVEELLETFPELKKEKVENKKELIPFYISKLAFQKKGKPFKDFAISTLHNFINNYRKNGFLENNKLFKMSDFFSMVAAADIYGERNKIKNINLFKIISRCKSIKKIISLFKK